MLLNRPCSYHPPLENIGGLRQIRASRITGIDPRQHIRRSRTVADRNRIRIHISPAAPLLQTAARITVLIQKAAALQGSSIRLRTIQRIIYRQLRIIHTQRQHKILRIKTTRVRKIHTLLQHLYITHSSIRQSRRWLIKKEKALLTRQQTIRNIPTQRHRRHPVHPFPLSVGQHYRLPIPRNGKRSMQLSYHRRTLFIRSPYQKISTSLYLHRRKNPLIRRIVVVAQPPTLQIYRLTRSVPQLNPIRKITILIGQRIGVRRHNFIYHYRRQLLSHQPTCKQKGQQAQQNKQKALCRKSSHNPYLRVHPPKAKANSLQVQGNHIHCYFPVTPKRKREPQITQMNSDKPYN